MARTILIDSFNPLFVKFWRFFAFRYGSCGQDRTLDVQRDPSYISHASDRISSASAITVAVVVRDDELENITFLLVSSESTRLELW